ncbi:MAG: transcriptional regulator [Chloroflexota bacterium]|nr:transcriptional regulator [Chloroflexota bacterium]
MAQKLIKTEGDYNLTLARIEKLMDAEPGTPEFDDLELMSTLVEIYEDARYPIDLPDPIAAIRFRMEQLELSPQNLIPFIGSRSKVSEVLNGKRTLTLAMMRALHKGLGIPSDILLQEAGSSFLEDSPDVEYAKFPVAEMAKKGWVPAMPDIASHAEEIIRDLIDSAGGMQLAADCLFRKSSSSRENVKNDPYNLKAWCLKVLELANKNPLPTQYKKDVVDADFLRDIAKLSYFNNGPLLAKEYLGKHGIHLVTLSHLSKTYLDGAVMTLQNNVPVIGLTLRYDRIDNYWFCLMHELAHINRHLSEDSGEIIIDDLDLRGYESDIGDAAEQEADSIAQEALIPAEYWNSIELTEVVSPSRVKVLAEELKIHPAIIAGRIRHEKKNYKILSRLLGHREVRKQFSDFI